MLACFFGRRPKIGSGRLRQVRPSLELLETRDCPSAAVITSFTAINTDGYHVQLSGQLTDESPATCLVQFSGVITGQVYADTRGHFAMTATVARTGTVTAVANDDEGLTSDAVLAKVCENAAPNIINFYGSHSSGTTWTFYGQVADESPGTCVVKLGGPSALQGRTVQVNTDGTFSITVEIPEECTWVATAKATDMYGLESDLAYYASP